MPDVEKTKRVRSRTNYVMVEFTPDERADLELIRDRRSAKTGERVSMSGMIRYLVSKEAKR